MFILLPPSEGKALGGLSRTKWNPKHGVFGPALGSLRHSVISALAHENGGSGALLGVSGKHLERAQSANLSLVGAASLPAAERYTGVVWGHLDLATLAEANRNYALDHIIVVSGLLGAVLASDPTPDYRLKMGGRLSSLGTMSKWWRSAVSDAVNSHCASELVVDLLPNEHRGAFVANTGVLGGYATIDIMTKKDNKAGGHDAKAAKGLLARHLFTAKNEIRTEKQLRARLAQFTHPLFHVVTKVN